MTRVPVFGVVAEEWWEYEHGGETHVAHVAIGKPFPDDYNQWFCPLKIDGGHQKTWRGWKPIHGAGPFDATMNALMLAHRMYGELNPRPMPLPKTSDGMPAAGRGARRK